MEQDSLLQEFLPDRARRTKERLKESQKKSSVSIDWMAHCLGVSSSRLYQLLDLSPAHAQDNFALKDLEIWITETGDFGPLDDIEARLGRVAFRQPRALETATDLNLQMSEVFHGCAALCQAVAGVAAPAPEISWEKYKEIKAKIRQAHRQLAILKSAARQQAARHPSWPRRLMEKLAGLKARAWRRGE